MCEWAPVFGLQAASRATDPDVQCWLDCLVVRSDELWEWVRASWGPAVPAAPSVIEEDLRKQLDRSQTAGG